ncbi:MAG: hypothetical protein ACI9MR_004908, partial [Myxococcota bacterium]
MKNIIQNVVISVALAGTISVTACDGDKKPAEPATAKVEAGETPDKAAA